MSLDHSEMEAHLRRGFGDEAQLHLIQPDDLVKCLKNCAEDDAIDTIIVAGGDGTVSLAGKFALENEKRLGVLPLGTMNLFARAMRIPLDFEDAVTALADGLENRVDVGMMNGEPFFNHVSIGLHPRVIQLRGRMSQSGRLSKIFNTIRAYARVMSVRKTKPLHITGPFAPFEVNAGLAVVSINPVPEEAIHLPFREGQSYGKLACYVSTHKSAWQLNVLLARLAAGNWQDSDHMEYREATHVEIDADTAVHASIDGEVVIRQPPLNFEIRKQALRVLQPRLDPQ